MDRPYLVLIQPQIHNGAVERGVKAVGVWKRSEIMYRKLPFSVKFSYLLMWEGMAS